MNKPAHTEEAEALADSGVAGSPQGYRQLVLRESNSSDRWVIEFTENNTLVSMRKLQHTPGVPAGASDEERQKEDWLVGIIAVYVMGGHTDSWFPEYQEMRAAYEKAKAELNASYAKQGRTCPDCELGAVARSVTAAYREPLLRALKSGALPPQFVATSAMMARWPSSVPKPARVIKVP